MNDCPGRTNKTRAETLASWKLMGVYERFEQVVTLVLAALIATIIVVALWRLMHDTFRLLRMGAFDPLEHSVFQGLFGAIMTLLIAMEFKHSILRAALRRTHIVQVKTVILIAQLALARKFIILELNSIDALQIAALGFGVLVLAVAHWMLRERDSVEGIAEAIPAAADSTSKKPEDT